MPEVIYHVATSLDGFIATPKGEVDWLDAYQGEGNDAGFGEFYQSIDALLLGSGTYQFALDYGQWMSPEKPSWVFTKRDLPLMDSSIELTPESPASVLERIDGLGLNRVWLMGGGKLATSFREKGLIDEIRLAVIPIILGTGIPLFAKSEMRTLLELTESKSYPNGITSLSYRLK